jgi:hypothetical protein
MLRRSTRFLTRESGAPERLWEKRESALQAAVPVMLFDRPWLIAAAVIIVGLGLLGYYYFGPELRRYLRMSRM